jgi:phage regulator Rha-like protein
MTQSSGNLSGPVTPVELTLTNSNDPRIDSRLVSTQLGNKHKAVLSLLDRYINVFKTHGQLTFKKEVGERKQGGGNAERYALLNENQTYLLLNLSRNTEIVVVLKSKLITAFSNARRAAEVHQTEYRPAYRALHDAIKLKADGSLNERFMHMNANKVLNQVAGIGAGERSRAGFLQQSLLAVGAALAAKAVLRADDSKGLQQLIKTALLPLDGALSLEMDVGLGQRA